MFTNLKDKLFNVSNLLHSPSEEKPVESVSVDLTAGIDILDHFQQEWSDLHQINEDNAKHAEDLANTIADVHSKITNDHTNIVEIIRILNMSPTINKSIENCLTQIRNLKVSFEETEKKLFGLEMAIEDQELEKRKTEHRHQLECYKEKKLANIEKLKLELATQHALKEMHRMEERQQVFGDAFHSDLETFKSLGTIPKIETKVQPSALLEEVQLDLDEEDLETFLNSK